MSFFEKAVLQEQIREMRTQLVAISELAVPVEELQQHAPQLAKGVQFSQA